MGTLRYASPEQVLSAGDIDHRSDIYSLGATLWELLTLRPIQDATCAIPIAVLMRRITSDDPDRIRKHHPGIARDLEAIVQKCLEKDPDRRYATAAALADDLGRWLRGDLVAAQPLTFRYWAGKLARRHRWPIAAAATLIVLVASGAVYEIARSNRANERLRRVLAQVDEQKKKVEGALARAEAAGADAKKAADKAEAINNFLLNDMLAQAAPEKNARERKVTVEELPDRAAVKIEQAFADQPEVQAAIRTTIGTTYWKLGENAKAESQLRSSWESRRKAIGPEHPDTLNAFNYLARVLVDEGELGEAETIIRKVLEIRRRILGPEHQQTLGSMNYLVMLLSQQGKLGEAEALGRQALEAQRRSLGPEHFDSLASMNNLATVLRARGKLPEAEALHREALEILRRTLSPDGPHILTIKSYLASVLLAQGKLDEAEVLDRQVLESQRRILGPEHPYTLTSMGILAVVLQSQGKLGEAEALDRQVLEAQRRISGPEHFETLTVMGNLAQVLQAQGKFAEAETIYRQLLEARRRIVGPEHPDTLNSWNNLTIFLLDQGKPAEAEPLLRELLLIRRKAVPVDTLAVANTLSPLGWALTDNGRADEAEPLLREALAIRQKGLPPGRWATASTESILGACLARQGGYAEAEPMLKESLAVLLSAPGAQPERVRQALERIIALYDAWGKPEQAAAWRLKRLDFDFPEDPFVR